MQIRPEDPDRPWFERGVYRAAPDVFRIPLPLTNDHLRAVNVYAIVGVGGIVLVDPGLDTPESRAQLQEGLSALDAGVADVSQCVVTHVHNDHLSQSLRLQDELGIRVALGRHEIRSVRILSSSADPFLARFARLRRYGAADVAARVRDSHRTREDPVMATGVPGEWLDDGQRIACDPYRLRVIHTPGHTQGHVVFVDDSTHLLFAGDHVLSQITPTVGSEPAPVSLPLSDYLQSLSAVRSEPDRYLLPAHGPPGPSVHRRIDELLAHHRERLAICTEVVSRGRSTAAEVGRALTWTRHRRSFHELDALNQMLAILEIGAHLDLLVAEGTLENVQLAGVEHYEAPW